MDKNRVIKTARWIIGFTAGVGASIIVSGIIKNLYPNTGGIIKKIAVGVGGFGLAAAASAAASNAVEKQVDDIVNLIDIIQDKLETEEATACLPRRGIEKTQCLSFFSVRGETLES